MKLSVHKVTFNTKALPDFPKVFKIMTNHTMPCAINRSFVCLFCLFWV